MQVGLAPYFLLPCQQPARPHLMTCEKAGPWVGRKTTAGLVPPLLTLCPRLQNHQLLPQTHFSLGLPVQRGAFSAPINLTPPWASLLLPASPGALPPTSCPCALPPPHPVHGHPSSAWPSQARACRPPPPHLFWNVLLLLFHRSSAISSRKPPGPLARSDASFL